MKKHQNNPDRASALQVTLSAALLLGVAILFASSFKAATTAAPDRPQPVVVAQPGFYPPLPTGVEPTCTPIHLAGTIDTGDPQQTSHIDLTGVASTCGNPNGCSTLPGLYHYDAYTLVNTTGEARCVTATLGTDCTGGNAVIMTAYLGSFDPNNICTNLIGDAGFHSNGFPLSFSFNVPAGATFVLVATAEDVDAGCHAYKLDVFGLCPPNQSPTPTATPTATSTATPTATATATPTSTPSKVSQITPTNVTCNQFLSGTAPTLDFLEYSLKGTPAVINQVDPGVFFYWVKVTAAAGSNTFTINQAITSGNFGTYFVMQSGSNVFDLSCNTLHPTITQLGSTVTVQFNAPAAGTYAVLVKFSANTVKGAAAPSPGTTVHYNISTVGVPLSTEGLDLKKKGT